MKTFESLIKDALPAGSDRRNRRWIYVPYDRYTDRVGPVAEQPAADTVLVIVESTAKAHRRPYHKKKLALLIANMRHFALEQAERGCSVLYHWSPHSHGQALLELQERQKLPALTFMRPAERELRLDLAAAAQTGLQLEEVPDTTWLSTTEDFLAVYGPQQPQRHYVMDRFYRRMRQQTGLLMDGAKPMGGRFSFDVENRRPFRREIPVPIPPVFAPDRITEEVLAFVEKEYGHHFGMLDGFDLPVTQQDCDRVWQFALRHLLPMFGPFEDAMRDDEPYLFHSRISALVNLGRLLPGDLVRDVAREYQDGRIPLASAEGFIRQLLGWREFMRHLHEQTDGYRRLALQESSKPSDAARPKPAEDAYAGATPSALDAHRKLPAVYWGVPSGLHCVDTVVAQVIREGWSHHITRLMVLSNLATLCGVSPRELTDWFWFAYVDAYDWVVEPNVLGMATYADGGMTATKPYVSGAAYIHRMSNYCEHCVYDPKSSTGEKSCPFTALYWTFLARNEKALSGNARMRMPLMALRKKPRAELDRLAERAEAAIAHLESFPRPHYEETKRALREGASA